MSYGKHNRWYGLSLSAILLLAACSFIGDPPPSTVPLSHAFSANGGQTLPDRWWESFADPDLNQLIDQALVGNFNLKIAYDRLDQAKALARKAGADLSPTLGIEGRSSTSWVRNNGEKSENRDYSIGLVARYELDLWGRIRSHQDATLHDLQASTEDLQAAGLTLTAQVASTWYQLIEQTGRIKILNEQIAINSKALELITLQFRTGKVGIADVLQQRQVIETNRGEISLEISRKRVLEHQLAILLGETPGLLMTTPGTKFNELPPLPVTGTPANLVQRRPDIRSAWNRVRAADYRVAEAVADRFPRFALTGRVETSSGDAGKLFNNWLATLAVNMIGPVIDGGQRRAEVDRSRALATEALHNYSQIVLESFGEVEDALTQEQQQHFYLTSLDKQLSLAQQSIETIRERYLKGAEDYQRVLTALLSYQSLQRKQLTARRELLEFRINLCRALGGGWEMSSGA